MAQKFPTCVSPRAGIVEVVSITCITSLYEDVIENGCGCWCGLQ